MEKKRVEEMKRLSVEEFSRVRKIPLVVVLDNVRSCHNVGAVFRTSDAFVVEKIFLCGITPIPPHTDIHKTALGAEEVVSWEYAKDTAIVVEKLKQEGYTLCAVEQVKGSMDFRNFHPVKEGKYALILGNEVHGVQQSVVDKCDVCLELPQYGTKHSLNVSVTAGIVIWKMFCSLYEE
ncbi:MAG TPA: RNA methyltransferase [Porphyromonadaceae bacterium]|nr:RNA methyltransferase [Porphyromonadaceae bacterium]